MIEERIEKGKEGESNDRNVDVSPSASSTTPMIEERIDKGEEKGESEDTNADVTPSASSTTPMIEERIEKGKEKGESKDRIVDATPSSSSTTHMIEESIVTVGDEVEEDPVTSIDIEEIEDHMFHRDEPTPSPVCWAIGLSFRALVSIVLLTVVISMILTELFMMSGVSAPVDVPASLGGFMMVDKWIKWRTQRSRRTPFSLQKNILIRICVVTASAVIFGGGFGIFLIGVDRGPSQNIGTLKKDVPVWQMIFFLLITTCSGLFYVLYLRKVIYKLPYPNADTIATLIGSFHDLDANKTTRRQMSTLRYFIIGFMWAICQWIVSKETSCGFSIIPIFGQKAFTKRFSFDFSMTYVGLGMIALRTKIFSMLIGATFSWGIMWPIIQSKKGRWYSAELNDTNLHRLGGYQAYTFVVIHLGDALFRICKSVYKCFKLWKKKTRLDVMCNNVWGSHCLVDNYQTTRFFNIICPMVL